jgi:hypothetical protein
MVLSRAISPGRVSHPGSTSSRIQADDAVRRVVELALLGVVVMRRVIGRDAIDRPVFEPGANRLPIGLLPKRRVHLRIGIVSGAPFMGEAEVVGRGLGGHIEAVFLGPTYQVD